MKHVYFSKLIILSHIFIGTLHMINENSLYYFHKDSSCPQLEIVCITLFVSCSLFFFPFSESIYFEITRFSADGRNIHYTGDAVPSFGVIQLNQVEYQMRVGHAIYADPVQIWDNKSLKLSDLSTHFITLIVDTCFFFLSCKVWLPNPAQLS